jgi:hypothetical protein
MEPGSQKNSSKHQQHNNCQPVKPGIHLRAAAAAAKQHMHDPAVKHVVSQLGSAKKDTQSHAIGTILFGGVLFAAGAAPWALPWLFVLFALTCLPWRAYSFIKQKWVGTTARQLARWPRPPPCHQLYHISPSRHVANASDT